MVNRYLAGTRRWNLLAGLTDNWWGCGNIDAFALHDQAKETRTTKVFANQCANQILKSPDSSTTALLSEQLTKAAGAAGQKPDAPLTNAALAKRMLAWSAMTPEFQLR